MYFPGPIGLNLLEDIEYPELSDILFTPHPLVRKDVLDSLLSMDLFRTQYLPVDIKQNGQTSESYFLLYSYNSVSDFLLPLSEDDRYQLSFADRINEKKLTSLPLNQRLLFHSDNAPDITIMHASVKAVFDEQKIQWELNKLA